MLGARTPGRRVGGGVLDGVSLCFDREAYALRDRLEHEIRRNIGIGNEACRGAPDATPRSARARQRRTANGRRW